MKFVVLAAAAATLTAFAAVPAAASELRVSREPIQTIRIAIAGKTDAQVNSEIKAAAATVCGVAAGDCVDATLRSATNQYAAIKRAAQRDANPAKLDVAREDHATIRVKVAGRTVEQINGDIDLAAKTVCKAVGAGDFRSCVASATRSAKSQLREITLAQQVASR